MPEVSETELSYQAIQFLTKVSQGIKGNFTIPILQEIFKVLPGWKIASVLTADLIKDPARTPVFNQLTFASIDRFIPCGVNEPAYWIYPSEQEAQKGLHLFTQQLNRVGKEGPQFPTAGQVYYTKLLPVEDSDSLPFPRVQGKDYYHFGAIRFWQGISGWQVTTPKGNTYSFNQPITYKQQTQEFNNPGFWAFVYTNKLDKHAKLFLSSLDNETKEKAIHPSNPRSKENTGTCPVCFRNIKLVSGAISRHGWVVQGTRQRGVLWTTLHSGACFGVHYKPFEVSSLGTEEYLRQILRPTLTVKEAAQKELMGKPKETYQVKNLHDKVVLLVKGTAEYDRYWKGLVAEQKAEIQWLRDRIEDLQAKVASWEYIPLPGLDNRPKRIAFRYLS